MTKYEFNYLEKQISNIQEALRLVTDKRESRKLYRRLSGLELLRDDCINKQFGVIV